MNEFQSTQSDQQNLVLVPFKAFYLYYRILGAQNRRKLDPWAFQGLKRVKNLIGNRPEVNFSLILPDFRYQNQAKTRFILFRSRFKDRKSKNSTGNGPEVDFRRKLGSNRAQTGLWWFQKRKNLTGNRPEVFLYLIQKWSSRLQKCDSNLAKIDIRNESDLSLLFIISPKCKIVRFPYFLILTDLYRKFFVKSN